MSNPADEVRAKVAKLKDREDLKVRVYDMILDHTKPNPLYFGAVPADEGSGAIECENHPPRIKGGGPAYKGDHIPRHTWSIFGAPGSEQRHLMIDALLEDFKTGNLHTIELAGSDPYTYGDGFMRTTLVSDHGKICMIIVRAMDRKKWDDRVRRNQEYRDQGSSLANAEDDPFDSYQKWDPTKIVMPEPVVKEPDPLPDPYECQGKVDVT